MRLQEKSSRAFQRLVLVVLIVLALLPGSAQAVDVPPTGLPTYLQTSGPTATIGTGDWYTNNANGVGAGYHYFDFTVPCGWPASDSVSIDLFSPEMVVAAAGDEVRPTETLANANNTVFELYRAGTVVSTDPAAPDVPGPGGPDSLGAVIYAPKAAGEEWVRFQTLAAPVTCGTYVLRAATEANDDNSWRLRIGYDDDADPNNPPPANSDNRDGLPGTNDEIVVGVIQASYQHNVPLAAPAEQRCLTLYEFVEPNQAEVRFHNFDLDTPTPPGGQHRVRYYAPSAAFDATAQTGGIVGVASTPSVWNNGTIARGGDVIANPEPGWWRIVTCVTPNNQYVQEAQFRQTSYYSQPPIPLMTVAKDDGVTVTGPGETLTYTITYANIAAGATAGAATDVVIRDTIPTNTTYVGCTIPAAVGGCAFAAGVVTFTLADAVNAGASGSVAVTVQVNPDASGTVSNAVTLDYGDALGNSYPQVSDTDVDQIPTAPLMTLTKDDGVTITTPGANQTYTIGFANVASGPNAGPATAVVLRDTLPANTTYIGCAISAPFTGTCAQAAGVVTFTLNEDVLPGQSGTVTVQVTVNAGASGTVENTVTLNYNNSSGTPQPPRTASDIDQIPAPDLRILKAADRATVQPGQPIVYTLTYFNDTVIGATGVEIDETVPVGTTFVAAGSTPGWSCPDGAPAGTPCTLALGALAGNASGSATFVVRVNTTLPAGLTRIDNTATIGDDGTRGPDPTPANNIAQASLPPTAITLQHFTVSAGPRGLTLDWATGVEIGTAGFHLYRSASGERSGATQVTGALIVARGGPAAGAAYKWDDRSADPTRPATYWLVEVERGGGVVEYGPFRYTPPGLSESTVLYLPLLQR